MTEIVYKESKAVEMMNKYERFMWNRVETAEKEFGEDSAEANDARAEWSGVWTIMQLLDGKAVQYSNGDIGEIG